jgi:hypothetical protein
MLLNASNCILIEVRLETGSGAGGGRLAWPPVSASTSYPD